MSFDKQEQPTTKEQVEALAKAASDLLRQLNLDSPIEQVSSDTWEKEMPKVSPRRQQAKVEVNGKIRWIHGYSQQELLDDYVNLLEREGLIQWTGRINKPIPQLEPYLKKFVETFKNGQASLTIKNRWDLIRKHIIPKFGKRRLDEITTTDIQEWYNDLAQKYCRETILKLRNIISPAMDAAVEEDLIPKNPFKSIKLEIGGKASVHHKAIPKIRFNRIKSTLPEMENSTEKYMFALLCYTGMRFEEVLGLQWEDYDGKWLTVQRAVVHPMRNMPEIKDPKTFTSRRKIPVPEELKSILGEAGKHHGFIVHTPQKEDGESPLTYTEARNTFNRVRKRYELDGYSAHDFRDTCATVWRENGMPLDLIARLLGHSKTETTEKRYVHYREDTIKSALELM